MLADVTDRLDLRLADGRSLSLAGLERLAPGEERAKNLKTDLTQWLQGQEIRFRPLAAKPDRWGRLPALVFGPAATENNADAPLLYINEALVAAGMLRVNPDPEANECLGGLYDAEAQAREAKFGIWSDTTFAPVEAADTELLAAHAGQFTLVEGRARRVGQGRFRTYVDFGKGRGDFSFSLPKKLAARFAKAGHPLEGLVGQMLRLRGVIETRFGPQLDIFQLEQIEFIEGSVDQPLTKRVDKEAGR